MWSIVSQGCLRKQIGDNSEKGRDGMELIKKNVHMNRLKGKRTTQLTVDDDFNVSDAKPDIDMLITENGDVVIDSVKVQSGKIIVKGKLCFKLLYSNEEASRHIHNLNGEIFFEEPINMDDITEGDNIGLNWDIDDLKIDLINSRKISVKSIITFHLLVENLYDIETATEVLDETPVQHYKTPLDITEIAINKKDIYRIKEEIDIPQNKGNIGQMLWNSVNMQGIETKLMDDKITVTGQLVVFVMYQPVEESAPMQWMENVIPFHGMLDVGGCREEMIPNIMVKLNTSEIEPKADSDGELRSIGVDVVLDLDIKIYEESTVNVLSDVYSTNCQLKPVIKDGFYESLLVKNISKCKISDKAKVDIDQGHILQICSTEGNAKVDEINVVENGIEIEGVVYVSIMYISNDDKCPLKSVKNVIPFTYTVEAQGITPESIYFLKQSLEQISANMISAEEIEIKGVVTIDTLVLNKVVHPIIVDVEKEDLDMEELAKAPCIVGYLVQKGDTLWNIAKENNTTVENIMEINELQSDLIHPGDKIIIVKQACSMV